VVTRRDSRWIEPVEPTRVIGQRVAAIRRYLGLTQEQLAEALQGVGIDMERVTVAKLENGRRSFVTVDELLALCVVLAISPTDLLVPRDLDDDRPYQIVPNGTTWAANAREFIRGEEHLYIHEYPGPPEDPEAVVQFVSPGRVIDSVQWMPADRAQRVDERHDDTWIAEEEERRASDHQVKDQIPRDHQDHDGGR
jgi:transcriptional regulator with XRE-family HTH domain